MVNTSSSPRREARVARLQNEGNDFLKALFTLVFLAIILMGCAYTWGYSAGMKKSQEISDQVDCEFEYGYKPLSETPVKCLKYFDLKEDGSKK